MPSSHGPEVAPDAGAELAARLLAWVDDRGVVLVHDRSFPSATSFVVGEPVSGSWWAHPAANRLFDAIERLERELATVKLVAGKETLVARRLWPALAAVGAGRERWQVERLDDGARAWLARVDASDCAGCHEAVRKGAQWLKANQRESGSWFTGSLGTHYHLNFISHSGSAFALMALKACE